MLTVTGHSEAYIENYRGIIEYTEQRIRLQTKTCQMTLCGEQLHIDYYTEDEMKNIGADRRDPLLLTSVLKFFKGYVVVQLVWLFTGTVFESVLSS